MPKISIVIPTYNRAHLLRRAIDSVLSQQGVDIELVISDNCSSDSTGDVVREYLTDSRVKYFCNESNVGMVNNWKLGIFERSSAEWFVLMSDDDFFTDCHYLSRASKVIDSHSPVFVYAGGVVHDSVTGIEAKVELPFSGLVEGKEVFASRGTVKPQDAILCNMIFRVKDALRLGFLSNQNNLSCDSELYLKLCAEGNVYAFNQSVCVYYKHGSNLVDTIGKTEKYLVGNLDYMINPLIHAQRMKMKPEAIANFIENVGLRRAIEGCLLKLELNNKKSAEALRESLSVAVPTLTKDVCTSWVFILKLALVRTFPWLLRNRYRID